MTKKEILISLSVAFFLAIFIAPFASAWPDGLEKVAEDKGFLEKGETAPLLASPVPDYAWPGLQNEMAATSAAGAAGTLLILGIGIGTAILLKEKQT